MNLKTTSGQSNVTVVLTSCGRWDLLKRTLNSFFLYNTCDIADFIIIEDSGKEIPDWLHEYPVRLVINKVNIGQVLSIDLGYSFVNTDYIFHCEDDWEFYRLGFIEESHDILMKDNRIVCVWIMDSSDTNGHPFFDACDYYVISDNYKNQWHGFSWNPGLRRLRDYKLIGSFSSNTNFDKNFPFSAERKIGKIYKSLGFYAAMTKVGYVKHIGWGMTVK